MKRLAYKNVKCRSQVQAKFSKQRVRLPLALLQSEPADTHNSSEPEAHPCHSCGECGNKGQSVTLLGLKSPQTYLKKSL
jgi:hypothetical protein